MKKIKEGKYELNAIELAALVSASIERVNVVLNLPDWNPQDDATPYIVNEAYELLYGIPLFEEKSEKE